jgi:hypothetical protein
VTCVVQTLDESDHTAQARFVKRLEKAYASLRDEEGIHFLETLSWVRELLTGFNIVSGQGTPFLKS